VQRDCAACDCTCVVLQYDILHLFACTYRMADICRFIYAYKYLIITIANDLITAVFCNFCWLLLTDLISNILCAQK